MSIKGKERLLGVLRAFNYLGLILLLFLTFQILGQIKRQAVINHDDTARAVIQIKKDHDTQNKYLQCLVNLFTGTAADIVTSDQVNTCLVAVRSGTTKTTTIKPTAENGQTTTTTTTNQSSPSDQPKMAQEQPQPTPPSAQPTTSAPPDPTPQQPSIIEQVTNPITNLIKGVL